MGLATKIRRRLLSASVGFSRWLGKVHAPWTHKMICGLHYVHAEHRLMPGDVLMSRTEGELTNIFIPGFWSHGAVYVGGGFVVEAIGEGVVRTDLVTWMLSKDHVRICRPRFADSKQMEYAASWCANAVGSPYDYEFTSGNKAFYCFELTYAAYQEGCGIVSPWQLRLTLGVPTVVGDDFDHSGKWHVVWDSRDWQALRRDGRSFLQRIGSRAL